MDRCYSLDHIRRPNVLTILHLRHSCVHIYVNVLAYNIKVIHHTYKPYKECRRRLLLLLLLLSSSSSLSSSCAPSSRVILSHVTALLPPPRTICNRRCLSVCLLATLRKNFWTDSHEIFRKGWQWATEQTIKFWWRFGSRIRIRIHIATLVTW